MNNITVKVAIREK